MRMLFGIGLGFLAGWMYGSERARSEVQRRLNAAPQSVQQARQSMAAVASTGADRVSGVIDAAPLPRQMKDRATRMTAKVRQAGGEARAGTEYIGTPGVESALGRDRTTDGDLPPDLASP